MEAEMFRKFTNPLLLICWMVLSACAPALPPVPATAIATLTLEPTRAPTSAPTSTVTPTPTPSFPTEVVTIGGEMIQAQVVAESATTFTGEPVKMYVEIKNAQAASGNAELVVLPVTINYATLQHWKLLATVDGSQFVDFSFGVKDEQGKNKSLLFRYPAVLFKEYGQFGKLADLKQLPDYLSKNFIAGIQYNLAFFPISDKTSISRESLIDFGILKGECSSGSGCASYAESLNYKTNSADFLELLNGADETIDLRDKVLSGLVGF
jgi:hypothetical protein